MSEVKKCPKCAAQMVSGEVTRDVRILKEGDLVGDRVYAFFCRDCGFIELYKEPSTKEPWRQPKQQKTPLQETQKPEEKRRSTEPSRKKLIR